MLYLQRGRSRGKPTCHLCIFSLHAGVIHPSVISPAQCLAQASVSHRWQASWRGWRLSWRALHTLHWTSLQQRCATCPALLHHEGKMLRAEAPGHHLPRL